MCAPLASSGWTLAVIALGAAPDAACPAGYEQKLTGGIDVTDTGCPACSGCAPPVGKCSLRGFPTGVACTPGQDDHGGALTDDGSCVDTLSFYASGQWVRVQATASGVAYLTCKTSQPEPHAPVWKTPAVVCRLGAAAASCAGGTCAPVASAQFVGPCVISGGTGDQSCPAGYPVKHAFGTTISDNRKCTGCSCVPAGCTGGQIEYCGAACGGACVAKKYEDCAPGGFNSYKVTVPAQPACAPSGSAVVSGSIEVGNLQVVCCAS